MVAPPLYTFPSQLSIKSSNYVHLSPFVFQRGQGYIRRAERKKKKKQLQNGIRQQPTARPSHHRRPLLVVDRLRYHTAC